MQGVYAGRKRRRAETEYIVIRHVIRDRDEIPLQVPCVMKVKVLASCQFRHCFGGVGTQRTARGKKGHGCQPERRSKLADAVQYLSTVVALVLGVGSVAAEAAMGGARFFGVKLLCFMRDCRCRARKAEGVHRRVRVADEP